MAKVIGMPVGRNFDKKQIDREIEQFIKANPNDNRGWTPVEIYKLRSLYGKVSRAQIAKHLNRTQEAISSKARQMGLVGAIGSNQFVRKTHET